MPTSASTGTEQMHSAGGGDTDYDDDYDEMSKEEPPGGASPRDLAVSGNKPDLTPACAASPRPSPATSRPSSEDQGGVSSAVTSEEEIERPRSAPSSRASATSPS